MAKKKNTRIGSMNFTENSDKQVIIDDRLHHFIETETKKQQFQVSFGFIYASKFVD